MCQAYEGSYANPEFRNDYDFVPFMESESVEIVANDLKEERH